jgi:hypothetical protein
VSRFVILEHDHPMLHWDLLLDVPALEGLWTWRLLEHPATSGAIRAERLPDHRRRYLDYEGPISGNRGSVTRWDAGDYVLLSDESDGGLLLEFRGDKRRGVARLSPAATVQSEPMWTLEFQL